MYANSTFTCNPETQNFEISSRELILNQRYLPHTNSNSADFFLNLGMFSQGIKICKFIYFILFYFSKNFATKIIITSLQNLSQKNNLALIPCRKTCRFISSCNLLKHKTRIYLYSLQRKPINIKQTIINIGRESKAHNTINIRGNPQLKTPLYVLY